VMEREPELTIRFYEHLFARHHEVEPLFSRNSRAQQALMLARALGAVVEHLEDASWLEQTLSVMGARHVGYGVTEAMYDWVGEALLETLAEVAGDAWSDELAAAWSEAYGAIAGLMKAGAQQAAA